MKYCSIFLVIVLAVVLTSIYADYATADNYNSEVKHNYDKVPIIPTDINALLEYYANDTLDEDDTRLKEQPEGDLTRYEILNGIQRWKPSPRPELIFDDRGFDYSRAGFVTYKPGKNITPEPYVHPRLLFTKKDLPAIKENLENTNHGRQLLEAVKNWEKEYDEGKTNKAKFYQKVLKGDIASVSEEEKGFYSGYYRMRFSSSVHLQALKAMVYNDNKLGRELAQFGVNYIRLIEKDMQKRRQTSPDWTAGAPYPAEIVRPMDVAIIYDLCYNWMEEGERDYLRNLIAENLSETYAHGMELPPHWRHWNFIPNTSYYALTALSIEGETGYDQRLVERSFEVMDDFLTYCFTAKGMGNEGMGYCLANIPNNTAFMWAMLRRGEKNLFAHPHFKEVFNSWITYTLQPNTKLGCFTHGDCGSIVHPDWEMFQIMKHFYPQDKTIDYLCSIFYPEKINFDRIHNPLIIALTCSDLHKNSQGKDIDYNHVPPGEKPLTYFDAQRGNMNTRSGWGRDETLFVLDGRQDMFMPSHDHSDRGNFILSAMGRAWSMDGWRATCTKYHSCITIDGWGQGYFATPASWVDFSDSPDATFGVIDYKYSFDWSWLHTPVAAYIKGEIPQHPKYHKIDDPYSDYKELAKNYKRTPVDVIPERDPLRKVADYYSGYMAGDPRHWGESTWPERIPNYPVEYAYRTGGLVRGKHNYVLIVDDIKKDDRQRLYEWTMITPLDVDVYKIDGYDIILGDKQMERVMIEHDSHGWRRLAGRYRAQKNNSMLLVRSLECATPEPPVLTPNPRLETYEIKKHDDRHQFPGRTMDTSKRLIIPGRSDEPRFKTLLFPHRHGDQLPTTTWNEDKTILSIKWIDQQDIVTFSKNDTGRTTFTIVRDGNTIVELN